MPNRTVHIPAGVASGATFASVRAINERDEVIYARAIGGLIGGYFGAQMPDIIDPSTNGPNHRSLGHGILPNTCAAAYLHRPYENLRRYLNVRAEEYTLIPSTLMQCLIGVLDGFIAGYVSHLVLDSFTPKGLPLLK